MSEEVADVIDGAADLIERNGLVKGQLVNPVPRPHDGDRVGDRSMCTIGALNEAAGEELTWISRFHNWHTAAFFNDRVYGRVHGPESQPITRRAIEAVARHLRSNNITAWNDADDRTQQEVLDLLREVAKDQRKAAVDE